MEKLKTKYDIVKRIVERHSNIEDISAEGKGDGISYIRYVYYQLCYDYDKEDYSHTRASKTLKRPHSNSIYGLKMFDKFKNQKFFHHLLQLYNECSIDLFNKINGDKSEMYLEILMIRQRLKYMMREIKKSNPIEYEV